MLEFWRQRLRADEVVGADPRTLDGVFFLAARGAQPNVRQEP